MQQKAQSFTSKLLYNKFFWQLILAVFMIGMAIFFVRHEHLELLQVQKHLANSNPIYITIGILVTVLYIILQGQMYVHSFKALGKKVPLWISVKLFLKRNVASVFLPAGGFASLALFTKEIEVRGVGLSKIHLASTIFALCGVLSVVVVAIPTLGFAMLFHGITAKEIIGFISLMAITAAMILFLYSVSKKGIAYRWISKALPSTSVILDEMISHEIDRNQFWIVLLYSMIIEFVGIAHLYISMLALGYEPSIPASIIGYVVMVILLIASPFLRGLGGIEVSLTYVLGQFGYPVVAAASITLLFRFFEFWLILFAGIVSFITRKDSIILRLLPALIIFILGVVNIISAITPALPDRLAFIYHLLSPTIADASNLLILVFGSLLVILSIFLFQGSKRAWYAGLFLTGFSIVGHLLKAADYEESILALIAFSALIYTKSNYKLKPHPKLTKISYHVLLYSILAVFLYGVIGLYFIDKKHFGISFELWASVKTIFRLFFLFDTDDLTPLTNFGKYFLYSIYTAAGLLFGFISFSLLKPYFSEPYNSEQDFVDAKAIVNRHGISALDFFKTYPDKFLFFSDDQESFISFKLTRHFACVLENPVAKDDASLLAMIKKFDQFCNDNGFICIYYRIPEKSLKIYQDLKRKILPLGEEAILDLATFSLEGSKLKTTRSAINRLTAEGCIIKVYEAPIMEGLLQKLEFVSDDWLEELDRKEVAFTQGVFDKSILKDQTIITVENKEEKVFAFLNIVPDYAPGEATYDLIRKVKDAPNGVLDMLLAKTFIYLKEKGYKSVNLGLAPLSGIDGVNLPEKTIKYAYDNMKAFGHFKGLRKYKEKFFPRWEKKYLVYSHNYHLLQVPNALKRVSEGN